MANLSCSPPTPPPEKTGFMEGWGMCDMLDLRLSQQLTNREIYRKNNYPMERGGGIKQTTKTTKVALNHTASNLGGREGGDA